MQFKGILSLLLSIFITSLAGLIIFILVVPPFSYIFFCIFLFLSFVITMTLLSQSLNIRIKLKLNGAFPCFLFVLVSVLLLIFQAADLCIEAINAALYLLAFILVPGFSILAILKFKPSFSRLEFLALAYPLSLTLLAIFGTVMLMVPVSVRGLVMSSAITLLSFTALVIKIKEVGLKRVDRYEMTFDNGTLILLMNLTFYMFIYIGLYPQISHLLGLDIIDNFMRALAFTKDPLGSFSVPCISYPLFSIYQSSIIYVVRPSLESFQIMAVFLNIFAILTFYAMATQYLKQYGDHVPAIVTLMWSAFSGLGWLDFFRRMLTNPSAPLLQLIGQANAFSYGDITWRRLFFYLSMEATLTLSFAVLYFVKRNGLSQAKRVILISLLLTPIPLMHEYATYFLLPTLLCLTLICTNQLREQLKSTGLSLIITSFVYLILSWILNIKGLNITVNILTFSGYLILGLFMIVLTYRKGCLISSSHQSTKKMPNDKHVHFIIFALALLYFASLLLWFSGDVSFSFGNLNRFGYVPWFLYPVKLGLIGLQAIIAIYLLTINSNPQYCQKEILAILVSALLLIIFSRAMSALQMQYVYEFTFNPNSWLSEVLRKNLLSFREERMFEIFKIPLAMIASIAFRRHIIDKLKEKSQLTKYLSTSSLISLILISGTASTLLGFTYYYNSIQTNQLTSSELEIIRNLQANIYNTGKAIIIASKTPTSYLDFTGAITIVTESPAAWQSKSPELPLFVTRFSKTVPTYIYLHKTRDSDTLSKYPGNYLEHLSSIAETSLENQEVKIKIVNDWSLPAPRSLSALVIPYNDKAMSTLKPFHQESWKSNTTFALFFQENMQSMNIYQDPIIYNNIQIENTLAAFNGINSYIRANGTNLNFDKIIVEFEIKPKDLSRNQVIVSKFDWGAPPRKSWEIAQYGKRIAFKLSADGNREEVLSTGELLELNVAYKVKCEYDGKFMKIFVNDNMAASKSYSGGIFKSDIDIVVGAELYNGEPTAFANMMLKYIRVLNDIPPVTEPIFYAYDLLSSLGLNYTTILSSDNTMENYKTLILPYDDITTFETLTKLEAMLQNKGTSYVIILNINGYGPLLSLFGNISSDKIFAYGISSDNYYPLQPPIEVKKIEPNKDTQTIVQYVNENLSSPLVMTITKDQITLIYVNIYPFLSQNQLYNPILRQALAKILGNYLEPYDMTTVTSWFTEPSLLFTKLTANGTISIQSNSLASIKLPENQTLNTNGYNTILLKSSQITIQRGYGFYTTLIASNPTITLKGNLATSATINGNATLLLRQPEISINGTIQFENFYMLHPPTIYTDGRTTMLSGNITLNIYVSDAYTIALPYKFQSSITVKYEKPLMEFSENTAFILMIPYIIIIVILVATVLLIQHLKPMSTCESSNETNKQDYMSEKA